MAGEAVTGVEAGSARDRVAAVEREFDGKAESYEENRLGPWYRAQADFVLRHLEGEDGREGEPIVDVGCGTGHLLRRFSARHPGRVGIGVDLSGRMVERSRRETERRGITGLTFLHADWEEKGTVEVVREALSRPAGLVTCVSAFHYFEDPLGALRRMAEVLRPGGRLLLLERESEGSAATRLWGVLHRAVIRDHVRFHRGRDLMELMRMADFEDVRVAGRIRRLLWKGKLYTSLVLLSGSRRGAPGRDP